MLTPMSAPPVRMHTSRPANLIPPVLVPSVPSVVQRTSAIPRANRPIALAVFVQGNSTSTSLGRM